MQLIAMMTMLIDHIGVIFFPSEIEWRVVGRIAFPLYAYAIIIGYRYTSNLRKYMLRLLLLAVIAQPPFMLAFHTLGLNVIFTLLLSLIVIALIDKVKNVGIGAVILIISALVMEYVPMDYEAYSLLLIAIYRYAKSYWSIALHFGLNVLFFFYKGWDIQMMSLISTIMIVMLPQIAEIGRKTTPVWLWRSFYPAHLLMLAILYNVINLLV